MAAANTDKLKKVSRKWVGQIGAGGVNDDTVTTIPLASSTNLATDTAVVVTIDRVDANGTATPALEETVIGVVSGNNLVSCVRGAEGTAQAHSAGAVAEVLLTAKGYNDIIDAFLVAFNQDGTIKSGAVLTVPQINDTSSDHQYIFSACELTADRTVTLPLLTGADEFVFKAHTQTLTNKTLTNPVINYTDTAASNNVKCRVYLNTQQDNLTDTNWTKVLFETENYDIGSDYDTTNKRFVAPVTGYYQVNVALQFEASSVITDKRYYVGIYVNGALTSMAHSQAAANSLSVAPMVSDILYVESGQYIEGYARVIAGANTVDIAAGTTGTYMSIHLLSI